MKPLSLILTVVLGIAMLPGLLGAPHNSVEAQDLDPDKLCKLFPCTYGCPAQRAGLKGCTANAIAQDTYNVAQAQLNFCATYACTPFACGPPQPGECEENQVEEQRRGNAGNLYPSKKLLRWLKLKPTYDTTFGDYDEYTNKDTYNVAQAQINYCALYACTPFACGPPQPGECEENQVEEQRQSHARKLQPLLQEKVLERLLSVRRSDNAAEELSG